MRRLLFPTILTGLVLTSLAGAQDEEKDQEKGKRRVIRIKRSKGNDGDGKAKKVVRGIFVDPKGKTQEFRLDGFGGKIDLKGLSKEQREKIQKALKGGGKNAIRVEVGKGIIIGPDGKKHEFSFGGGKSKEEALKGLPKEVRKQIEQAQKQAGRKGFSFQSFGKGIFIGPDGKKHEFNFSDKSHQKNLDKLPKKVREQVEKALKGIGGKKNFTFRSIGKGVIIGPDGKKREFDLGDGKFGESDILGGLPKEIRIEIERVLKDSDGGAKAKRGGGKRKTNRYEGDKLDLILKRLEQLEGQIRDLRKKVDDK